MQDDSQHRGPDDEMEMVGMVSDSSKEQGVEYELVIRGYASNKPRLYLSWLVTLVTLGFAQLIFFWKPLWRLKVTNVTCKLEMADKLLIVDNYGEAFVEDVVTDFYTGERGKITKRLRFFVHKKVKYVWLEDRSKFTRLRGFKDSTPCSLFHERARGLSYNEHKKLLFVFGPNVIKVPVKPILWLIVYEALNPFYLFQLYSSIVWMLQGYVLYTGSVAVMAFASICFTVWETRRQSKALRNRVESSGSVNVYRENLFCEDVPVSALVPGDVFEVPCEGSIECDAVLLGGSAVVNESMLTGESMPVTKVSLPDVSTEIYSPDQHKRYTLYCGTKVLQVHNPEGQEVATALVIRTGFSSVKGDLVRSILFPKPVDMKFYTDGMKFVAVSAGLGLLAMMYTTASYIAVGASLFDIIINALDIITFVVPPSLPATMAIGNIYAQRRLKTDGIFCLSTKYINMCGTVNLVCFDKTGTLTNDGMDMHCVVPAEHNRFDSPVDSPKLLKQTPLQLCMGTCHSLVHIDRQLTGDPLDLVMFESLGWELVDHGSVDGACYKGPILRVARHRDHKLNIEVSVTKQYPFTSNLQRMSVLSQRCDADHFEVYTKGAPETVSKLCRPNTVPEDTRLVLQEYASQGYRVLALAYKALDPALHWEDVKHSAREKMESDLTFLGLVVLRNTLKQQTISSLHSLRQANIRAVMVTGDNLLTAIHTARECHLVAADDDVITVEATLDSTEQDIDVKYVMHGCDGRNSGQMITSPRTDGPLEKPYRFAMDGVAFSLMKTYRPLLLEKVVQRGSVFARMLPDMKVHLVEQLQDLGYIVGMCGDGANDCGALKTANAGVSLSNTEASVASPFTSKQSHIECVPTLIREGRCALVSSFGLFKHLMSCSWVACITALLLYSIGCDYYDQQYMTLDLVFTIPPALFFANIGAFSVLARRPPPHYLANFISIFSMLSFIVVQCTVLILCWLYMRAQTWFVPWEYSDDNWSSYENTVTFQVLVSSLIMSSMVFCRGPPYRKRFYTNRLYTVVLLVLVTFGVLLTVASVKPLVYYYKLKLAPTHAFHILLFLICLGNLIFSLLWELKLAPTHAFHILLFLICLGNLIFSLLWEDFFINRFLYQYVIPRLSRMRGPSLKYERLEKEMDRELDWPPVDYHPQKTDAAPASTSAN